MKSNFLAELRCVDRTTRQTTDYIVGLLARQLDGMHNRKLHVHVLTLETMYRTNRHRRLYFRPQECPATSACPWALLCWRVVLRSQRCQRHKRWIIVSVPFKLCWRPVQSGINITMYND